MNEGEFGVSACRYVVRIHAAAFGRSGHLWVLACTVVIICPHGVLVDNKRSVEKMVRSLEV